MSTTPQSPVGRPLLLIAAVLIVGLGAAILWREYQLAAELATLRAQLKNASATPSAHPVPSEQVARTVPHLQRDLVTVKTYLAELQRQQQQTAELLNQTINELNRLTAATDKTPRRPWGPEQLLGEPDTMTAGDHPTAWSPREQSTGLEWIQLGYDRAVEIAHVRVRETNHPGAVTQVAAVLDDGREVVLWEGSEAAGPAPYDSVFNAPRGIVAKTIRIYLDTTRQPGREGIDAVELVGTDGSRQWATSASASSSYSPTQ